MLAEFMKLVQLSYVQSMFISAALFSTYLYLQIFQS